MCLICSQQFVMPSGMLRLLNRPLLPFMLRDGYASFSPINTPDIPHRSYDFNGVIRTVVLLMLASLILPQPSFAECQEYEIVEYENRVEAVCVGELHAVKENKAVLDEENIQESDAENQNDERLRLLKENSEKYDLNAVVDAEGVGTTGN